MTENAIDERYILGVRGTTVTDREHASTNVDGIHPELITYAHWVVHRDKQPYNPRTGTPASTTDSRTWGTFDEALEALKSGRFDGLGFVFSSGDCFCGLDLDNCRNPETGEIEEWAQRIIDAFQGAYKEVSPSGRGVHIIARGKTPNRKRGGLEIYSTQRFFTVSGRPL